MAAGNGNGNGDDERKFALETTFHFILLTGMLKAKKIERASKPGGGREREGEVETLPNLKSSQKCGSNKNNSLRHSHNVCIFGSSSRRRRVEQGQAAPHRDRGAGWGLTTVL